MFDKNFVKKALTNSTIAFQTEKDVLKAKITELERAIQNLILALSRGRKNEAPSVIFEKIDELAKQKEMAQQRLSDLEMEAKENDFNGINSKEVLQRLSSLSNGIWDLMDVNAKRRIIKCVVDKIMWDGNKIDIILS